MQSEDDQWVSPSFNSYSTNKLAEIAVRVSDEVSGDVKINEDSFLHSIDELNDDDFEFTVVDSGEEIHSDGQVRLIFPVFNRDLLNDDCDLMNLEGKDKICDKIPLGKLFIEEREGEAPPSSSSSEDELESIPPGSYCVWKPKESPSPLLSPSTCKKSKSTGSGSKRWNLRDFLRRSNSDGKADYFVFLAPKKKEEKTEKKKSAGKLTAKATPTPSPSRSPLASPLHEAYYTRNRATKGNATPKRKSYLPYRQDLLGFFTTVNSSLGRTLPRF